MTGMRRPARISILAVGMSLAAFLLLGLLAARPAHADTFTVNSTGDAGDGRPEGVCDSNPTAGVTCTLREAIQESNASTAFANDAISFDIPAGACNATTGVCTITPATQLPSITDTVTIDGYTQTGASENTEDDNTNNAVLKIELNGQVASGGITLTPGLTVSGSGASLTEIRGLVVNRFSLHGVFVDAGAVAFVEGNFIGTDPTGDLDRGNGFSGVLVTSSDNRIGGAANEDQNVISGNGQDGVVLAGTGATGNTVVNNHIGTDADAIDPLGNTGDGVAVFSSDTIVGGNDRDSANGAGDDDGTERGEGNIISGNGGHGVLVDNVFAEGTKIQGNHIGVDRNGSGSDLGNGQDGVRVSSTPRVEIGGATDGLGNTISGNGQHGVEVVGTSSTLVAVQGNRIGTNYIGRADRGNGADGVRLGDVSDATIGGAVAAARNLISGNDANGAFISGSTGATNNRVQGNFIGANVDGTADLGNAEDGVRVETPGNFVGGPGSAANTILGNDDQGVQVAGAGATGNRILRNSISENGRLAIELNDDAVTANDPKDPDAGPNDLQNFPTITSVSASGGPAKVQGRLDSTPNTTFTLQLFANEAPNIPTGFGEAQRFLGETTVTTNGGGDVSFAFTSAVSVAEGEFVTATATNPGGSTSELSFGVAARAPLVVNSTGDGSDALLNDFPSVCDTDPAASGPQCTLRAAIQEANSGFGGVDTIEFDIPGTGVRTIAPASQLPALIQPVTIDGYSQPGTNPNTRAMGTDAVLRIQLSGNNAGNSTGLTIDARDSVVRGLIINRFARGIRLGGGNTRIEGNFVGTDPSGMLDRGNTQVGVILVGSDDNALGGVARGARNIVSGNGGAGVAVRDRSAANSIEGNLIGTNRNGTGKLGNSGSGVSVSESSGTVIGGATAGVANTISFNGADGVTVSGSSTGNSLLRNSIFDNAGLGMNLVGGTESASGATANDPRDPDAGPNALQNRPVLTSAERTGAGVTARGKLNSTPNRIFVVRFFANPRGRNEGKTFLGQKSVTTDANGNVTFAFSAATPNGTRNVTATATRAGNTSEFSAPRVVAAS